MSIPSKQIGWSQESNLLWEISKQMQKLTNAVAATAGGGILNPTTGYIPFNSGLAFGDSFLFNDVGNGVLKTIYGGNNTGLYLDFVNFDYALGDLTGNNVGNCILRLAFGGAIFQDVYSGVSFFEIINNLSSATETKLSIDNDNKIIRSKYNGDSKGLELDFDNLLYSLGDFANNTNHTFLQIDDGTQKLVFSTNLSANSAGAASGKYLKVTINSVDYKIALLNNA